MSRPFRVNFSVPELKTALDNISKYNGKTAARIENAVANSTKAIGKGARQRVPVDSGGLKKSIRTRFDKKTITGTVRARKPHAHLVEFGAGPAVVKPKRKQALTIDEFGTRRYAKKARIPARAPRPFMRPAYEQEKPHLISEITKAVRTP